MATIQRSHLLRQLVVVEELTKGAQPGQVVPAVAHRSVQPTALAQPTRVMTAETTQDHLEELVVVELVLSVVQTPHQDQLELLAEPVSTLQ